MTIGPTMLYLRQGQTSETLTLVNSSTDDKEVIITTRFGCPESDTLGNVNMQYGDTLGDQSKDASGLVSFFPRRFFLKGGATQNVRFRARPGVDLKPGMYWTRVIVTSSLAQDPPERQTGVDAQLQFECAQNIPLLLVHKSADVNLRPRTLLAVRDSTAQSHLLVETGPEGNAPFVGSLGIVIMAKGNVIVNRTIPVSLYSLDRIRLLPDKMQLPDGAYHVALYWTMGRDNVLPQYASQFKSITEHFRFGFEGNGHLTTH